jgi:hypothetical protein
MMISTQSVCARRLIAAATLAAGLSSALSAQLPKESEDVRLRRDCRLAAQTLAKGHPAPKTDWALTVFFKCDESAGPALQHLWASPTADSVALEQLVQASARVLDQRVYLSVRTVATNIGSPLSTRIAALRVLASMVQASKLYFPTDLLRPSPDSTKGVYFSDGPYQTIGAQPLTVDVNASVGALFVTIAQSDPDPLVRLAAKRLTPGPG